MVLPREQVRNFENFQTTFMKTLYVEIPQHKACGTSLLMYYLFDNSAIHERQAFLFKLILLRINIKKLTYKYLHGRSNETELIIFYLNKYLLINFFCNLFK